MRIPNPARWALGLLILAAAVLYGMAAQRLQLFPYAVVYTLDDPFDRDPPVSPAARPLPPLDFGALMGLRAPADVVGRRAALERLLWGEQGFIAPPVARLGVVAGDVLYAGIEGLARIEHWRIGLDFGLVVDPWYFVPERPSGQAVVVHAGHGQSFHELGELTQALLARGHAVVGLGMLLEQGGPAPALEFPGFGAMELWRHEQLALLPREGGHPARLLIEPSRAVVDELARDPAVDRIAMVGLSGGGWVTTWVAALEPRVATSVPVAGTLPIALRAPVRADWGDWEQTDAPLYRVANYLELYLMGAHGAGRAQLQVLNRHDPVCFAGAAALAYAGPVQDRVAALGPGSFELFLDGTHEQHAISAEARDRVLELLARPAEGRD